MPPTFRTMLSVVYWTETTDQSQELFEAIDAALPDEVGEVSLVAVEWKPEGPPPVEPPLSVPSEAVDGG